jgi:hypothetical protein
VILIDSRLICLLTETLAQFRHGESLTLIRLEQSILSLGSYSYRQHDDESSESQDN